MRQSQWSFPTSDRKHKLSNELRTVERFRFWWVIVDQKIKLSLNATLPLALTLSPPLPPCLSLSFIDYFLLFGAGRRGGGDVSRREAIPVSIFISQEIKKIKRINQVINEGVCYKN